MRKGITVGVLALQGAFREHLKLLQLATSHDDLATNAWSFREVRNVEDLSACDALIIPGGESTAISLVASRSGLLEPLREFVKVKRKPVWGTCAGLILLSESANRTKKGGQDLIGGLDVRVNRNHFGRQRESFEAALNLPFLEVLNEIHGKNSISTVSPFNAIFIRAPVVERLLSVEEGEQKTEAANATMVVAPSKKPADAHYAVEPVELLATLPRQSNSADLAHNHRTDLESGDIVVVKQGNVFGTSFHPELTNDFRIHTWWLQQVQNRFDGR